MLAADSILPSDTSALYDSVANRDCVKLVHSFAKAVRHAFSAVSNRKNISDVAEEKVDEFFTSLSSSPYPNTLRSCRPATGQTKYASLGSYCWENLLHHSWSSSSSMDCHTHAHEIDSLIDECLSRIISKKEQQASDVCYGDKKLSASLVSSGIKKDLTLHQRSLQYSSNLSVNHMHDEDLKYLGKVLSNSRPPANFMYAEPRKTGDAKSSALGAGGERVDSTHVLFDGSHGPTNGSLVHLACIVDSPLILAILLSFGGDPSIRHTAFRRLPAHEAACSGSTNCLTLLLEISQCVVEESCHQTNTTMASITAEKERKTPSHTSSGHNKDKHSYPTAKSKSKLVLADPTRFGSRVSFVSALKLILKLNTKVLDGLLSELEAARVLLLELGISQCVRTAFISTSPLSTAIDGHGNTALHWASFKNQCGCVSVLLKSGSDSNFRSNHFGWTPLHDAAYSDSAEAVALLLEAGADIDARSNSGATPLCFAAQEDAPNATELLLKAGADAAVKCNGQQTMQQGNVALVNSSRINHAPSRFSGYTPLHYCSHYNAAKAARVLIKHCAPMEMEDFSGRRPIHIAVARGSSDVLRELLYAGTKVEAVTFGGSSMGQCASSAPPRLESPLVLRTSYPQALGLRSSEVHPQGRIMAVAPAFTASETIARQMTMTSQQSQIPAEVTPVSSPVLKALIPPHPVHSSKPWNCLTQQAIDECKYLLNAVESHWSPRTHKIFSPNDRRAIIELLKVGKRFEQMDTGIFLELWPHILSFCGRGWFEPNSFANAGAAGESLTGSNFHEQFEVPNLPVRSACLSANNDEPSGDDISVDDVQLDEGEDMNFTQFHLESDNRRENG